MSLRHGILGMLAIRPMSGYDLTREFDLSLGHVWSARHSQIYPELSRLEKGGLIEHYDSGPRGRKRYATTPAGRAEVVRWLREDEPGRELRVESLLQGFFYWMVEPEEQVALVQRERSVCAAKLAEYEQLRDSFDWSSRPEYRSQRIMLEAGIRYEQGLVEWADWAIEQIKQGAASAPAGGRKPQVAGARSPTATRKGRRP